MAVENDSDYNEELVTSLVDLCVHLNETHLVILAVSAIYEFMVRSEQHIDDVMSIIYETHQEYVRELEGKGSKESEIDQAMKILSKEDLTVEDILSIKK